MRLLDDYERSLTLYTYLNFDDQHQKGRGAES